MSRVGQFVRALAAYRGLNEWEQRWVREHLSPGEEALFWQMSAIDRKHAVRVSLRAAAMARSDPSLTESGRRALIRAGLLHDIGKVHGEIGLLDRVAVVVLWRVAPGIAKRLVAWGREEHARGAKAPWLLGGLCRAFYAQAVHAERGAAMAKQAGVEETVVDLIRLHHRPDEGGRLLKLFAKADA